MAGELIFLPVPSHHSILVLSYLDQGSSPPVKFLGSGAPSRWPKGTP